MDSFQLRGVLDRLSLSQAEAARLVGVETRIMRYWLAGPRDIPVMVEKMFVLLENVPYALEYVRGDWRPPEREPRLLQGETVTVFGWQFRNLNAARVYYGLMTSNAFYAAARSEKPYDPARLLYRGWERLLTAGQLDERMRGLQPNVPPAQGQQLAAA